MATTLFGHTALPDQCRAYRGRLVHFIDDPGLDTPTHESYESYSDGLLVVSNERVVAVGDAQQLMPALPPDVDVEHWPDCIIMPGFIDTHVHLPQLDVIASYGAQLLDWLNTYTFPAECRFSDDAWAQSRAQLFTDLLLMHGTTSALVFCTSHAGSVEALFTAAQRQNMAITAGKVMMDRNAPAELCDTALSSFEHSQSLIDEWHMRGRQRYAVTPRFAATSTAEQLAQAGELVAQNPSVLVQTHWAENVAEIEWTRQLFPERKDYLDVYQHYGLLNERSVLAHGIHIGDTDRRRLADCGARIAFCPTSNTFLGSGLFDLRSAREAGVHVGLASDVGGGTSLSMLATMAEAYKVCQLRGQSLTPFQAFYLATLGNARVLNQQQQTGNFGLGKYADFIVLDTAATPMLRLKQSSSKPLADTLFDLMILGDDRAIQRTYVAGQCRFNRDEVTGEAAYGGLHQRVV